MTNEIKLDAVESVFFKRQLEAIDAKVYETMYPAYKARSLLPTQGGVDPTDRVYTYRMSNSVGFAKFIANAGDDLPRATANATESSQLIKRLGVSYGYSVYDIRAAARSGIALDAMEAMAARRAIEEKVDAILSLGDVSHGLTGLLGIASGTTSFTPSTKGLGGLTWANATGDEMAADVIGIVSAIVAATKGAFNRFKVVVPIEQFNLLQSKRLSGNGERTALQFAQASAFVESIEPWYRCDGAGAGGTDRMCAFASQPDVVSALVPEEFMLHAPQERNLELVRLATAACGGVIARYPVAIAYGDGI